MTEQEPAVPEESHGVNVPVAVASVCLVTATLLPIFLFLPSLWREGHIPNPILLGSLIPPGLVLIGFIKGQRLAWQWGRIGGLLGGGLYALTALGLYLGSAHTVAAVLMLESLLLFIMFDALGRDSARAYFQLNCPECGSRKTKAANFFYTKSVCKQCDTKW